MSQSAGAVLKNFKFSVAVPVTVMGLSPTRLSGCNQSQAATAAATATPASAVTGIMVVRFDAPPLLSLEKIYV
jgi:hypothetical protein